MEQHATNQTQNAHESIRTYRLALFLIFLKPFGNLSLAWGMIHLPLAITISPLLLFRAFLNPFVLLGIVMQILWLVLRMSLFSLADLSIVLPLTASGYMISAMLGKFFLREEVSLQRWAGIVLICLGVAVASCKFPRAAGRA